jgi:large conductance mechanosensitive channel
MGIIQEFKEFALKGNALDLAVGVIIGAAFGKVVDSVVKDLFNPPLGYLIGGTDFKDLKFVMKDAVVADAAQGIAAMPEVAIRYGAFLDTCVQFLIVAASVFVAVRVINRLSHMRSLEDIKRLGARKTTDAGGA